MSSMTPLIPACKCPEGVGIKDFREGGIGERTFLVPPPPSADGKAPSDTGNCRAPERLTKPSSVLLNVRR